MSLEIFVSVQLSLFRFLLALYNFLTLKKIGQKETDKRNTVEMQGLIQGFCVPQSFVQVLFKCCVSCFPYYFRLSCPDASSRAFFLSSQ